MPLGYPGMSTATEHHPKLTENPEQVLRDNSQTKIFAYDDDLGNNDRNVDSSECLFESFGDMVDSSEISIMVFQHRKWEEHDMASVLRQVWCGGSFT